MIALERYERILAAAISKGGDAALAMLPKLGQGGCLSTVDGYRVGEELGAVCRQVEHAVVRVRVRQGYLRSGRPRF